VPSRSGGDADDAVRDALRGGFPAVRQQIVEQFGLTAEQLARDHVTLRAAAECAARTRGGGDYLVGDRFSVADLAGAALFLASSESDMITGVTITIDAGATVW
jgi:glutathione S-transferase